MEYNGYAGNELYKTYETSIIHLASTKRKCTVWTPQCKSSHTSYDYICKFTYSHSVDNSALQPYTTQHSQISDTNNDYILSPHRSNKQLRHKHMLTSLHNSLFIIPAELQIHYTDVATHIPFDSITKTNQNRSNQSNPHIKLNKSYRSKRARTIAVELECASQPKPISQPPETESSDNDTTVYKKQCCLQPRQQSNSVVTRAQCRESPPMLSQSIIAVARGIDATSINTSLDGIQFISTGFNHRQHTLYNDIKSAASTIITKLGGTYNDNLDELFRYDIYTDESNNQYTAYNDVNDQPVFCIADQSRRTVKAMISLARGLPVLAYNKYTRYIASQSNHPLNIKSYHTLSNGYSNVLNKLYNTKLTSNTIQLFKSKQSLPVRHRVLYQLNVMLLGTSAGYNDWKHVALQCGCNVYDPNQNNTIMQNRIQQCDAIIVEPNTQIDDQLYDMICANEVECVYVTWLIECVILQRQLSYRQLDTFVYQHEHV